MPPRQGRPGYGRLSPATQPCQTCSLEQFLETIADFEIQYSQFLDPDGNAIQVEDFSNVHNAQMREALQNALMLTKYKPAVCNGAPCTMQFKFTQSLKPG